VACRGQCSSRQPPDEGWGRSSGSRLAPPRLRDALLIVVVWLLAIAWAGAFGPQRAASSDVRLDGHDAATKAEALRQAGQYVASTRFCRQALRALPAGPQGDERRATLLELLGESLRQSFHAAESAAALEHAIAIYEKLDPRPHVALGRARQRLAAARLQQDRVADAETDVKRALTALAAVDGPCLERAAVYDTAGDIAWVKGRRDEADDWYSRAIQEAEATAGGPNLTLALSLRNKANSSLFLGRAQEAAEAGRRAFELAIQLLPARHPELPGYYNDAANLAWSQGELSTARRHWESALQLLPPGHPEVATVLNNLALLARDLGDVEAALSLKRRAIGLWRGQGPTARNRLARGYAELGRFLLGADRLREADAELRRALAILSAGSASNQTDIDRIHVDLARVASSRGDVVAAARHLERASESARGEGGSQFDRLVATSTAAALAWMGGDLERARTAYTAAAEGYARRFGPTNWNVAEMKTRLAEVRLTQGDPADAARIGREAEDVVRAYLRITIRDLSERLALTHAATRPPSLDVLVSAALATTDGVLGGTALTELARSRSQVFDELVERRRPRGDATPEEQRLREALQAARSRWANLAIRGPNGDADTRHASALAAASAAVEAADQALAEESAEFRRTRVRKEATVDDIRGGLPEGAVLVSFVRYGRRVPLPPRPAGGLPAAPPAPVPSYVAIVTSRSSAPVLVDLGDAATIDRLVAAWRDEAARGITKAGRTPRQAERAYRRAGTALRARVWDPLAAHVTGATRILVVPDGGLQAVTFAPLPVGTDRYLADGELAFHYLTTERDVMRPAATEHAESSLLAVGGVDFGGTGTAPASNRAAAPAPGATRAPQTADLLRLPINADGCVGFDEIEFPALPATAQEAREIEQMWRATGGTALRLSGGQARERRIRELAPRQRMLHFATHGFFLDSTCAGTVAGGTRSVRKRVRPGTPTGAPALGPGAPATAPPVPAKVTAAGANRAPVNPLTLSGLAFANANSHAATTRGEDDGVLTAEEVAALDLQGVEWVVLSACDTGLGPIRAREGVLGLRRAFEVAGARTVIMSLWSVEDRTTRLWMRELYRSRLRGRRDTIDSMSAANRAMLQARRAAGATTHPYYWAGFVATGDWR
jgi:CHAT domain-containing protein/tetratricopeptide (TPR) repeat protein